MAKDTQKKSGAGPAVAAHSKDSKPTSAKSGQSAKATEKKGKK